MPKVSLFTENIVVFLIVMIVICIFISVYASLSPEKSVPYVFTPYPDIAPTALPDPDRLTDNCFNRLTPCDSSGNCSACSLDNYECKTITQEQADAKLFQMNGITIPVGKWCLPKDHNPQPNCGLYTGRYVWSYDPAYCSSIIPGATQCWKCECLYPSLFGDPSTGCTTRLACQNDSPLSNSLSQPENTLKATDCSLPSLKGQTWDPINNPNPQGDAALLYQYTPYDQDSSGNPWFSCDCNSVVKNQFFAQLPGDPYTCHLEPCYKSLGSKASGLINCKGKCGASEDCSCSCDSPNVAMSPDGKFEGTCVLISQSCGNYGYDKNGKHCVCPAPLWERVCRNPETGVNMDNTSLPFCKSPENSLGSECYNPCEESQCEHGATCLSCGPTSYNDNSMCGLDNNTKTTIHAVCDCRSVKEVPNTPFGGFHGNNCQYACYPDGHNIGHSSWIEGSHHYDECACCCSQNFRKSSVAYGIGGYNVYCDGSDIYPPNPGPNPVCSPVEKCGKG